MAFNSLTNLKQSFPESTNADSSVV